MDIIPKIFRNKLISFGLRNADEGSIRVEAYKRFGESKSVKMELEKQSVNHSEQSITIWKNAVSMATDPEEPDRTDLADLYNNLMLDNHLASVIESRILFCQRSKYKFVDASGKENKEISKLFERPWFDSLIYKVLFSIFQGTTLLEFFDFNDEGELLRVNEIPQRCFNPYKRIIFKAPGDLSQVWDYDSPELKTQFLQIGDDDDLGELERLAIIVLSKKLGFGSWLDYIEKYGVPSLFINTDREDANRFMELVNMAKNFKSNNFVVTRGNETTSIQTPSGAGVAPFKELYTLCDEQISKRILGGSGITDEKSFVGSAEIQFKLAQDRFESDKKFFKHIFNAEIRPRLAKLSPIYAALEHYTFEWDDTESMTQEQQINNIIKLAPLFEIDPEFVEKLTGIPIIGQKNTPTPEEGRVFGLKK